MRNRYLAIVGILLLSGALMFGKLTSERPAIAADCSCSSCTCADTAKSGETGKCDQGDCMKMMKNKCMCKCMSTGSGKQVMDTYLSNTKGLRKDLADARECLNQQLQNKPVDKQAALELVDKINGLQSKLYKEAVSAYIDCCGKACSDGCKCGKSAMACVMMMSDQCPMKYCMQAMMGSDCAEGCGCGVGGECTCPKGK